MRHNRDTQKSGNKSKTNKQLKNKVKHNQVNNKCFPALRVQLEADANMQIGETYRIKLQNMNNETAPGAETVNVCAQERNDGSFGVLGLELSTF